MNPVALYTLYAVLALGAAALYLCLPKVGHMGQSMRVAGLIVGLATIGALVTIMSGWLGAAFEGRIFFLIFAALAVVSAVRVVTHSKPVYSALYFVMVVLSVTGLAVLASAEFLGIALVIVYAGAILVTYVFVIMLAQQTGVADYDKYAREPFAAVALGFILAAATGQAISSQQTFRDTIAADGVRIQLASTQGQLARPGTGNAMDPSDRLDSLAQDAKVGNVKAVGAVLMTTYVVAVEIAGVLLLVAMVGAIAIAQKRIEPSALTAQERQELTAEDDVHKAGREALPF